MAPSVTSSAGAAGKSVTICTLEMVLMPSCAVPRFSNSPDNSHIIQWDMPCSRSTRPIATAIPPTLATPFSHDQIATKPTENSSRALSMTIEVSSQVASRIIRYTVLRKPRMPSRA